MRERDEDERASPTATRPGGGASTLLATAVRVAPNAAQHEQQEREHPGETQARAPRPPAERGPPGGEAGGEGERRARRGRTRGQPSRHDVTPRTTRTAATVDEEGDERARQAARRGRCRRSARRRGPPRARANFSGRRRAQRRVEVVRVPRRAEAEHVERRADRERQDDAGGAEEHVPAIEWPSGRLRPEQRDERQAR